MADADFILSGLKGLTEGIVNGLALRQKQQEIQANQENKALLLSMKEEQANMKAQYADALLGVKQAELEQKGKKLGLEEEKTKAEIGKIKTETGQKTGSELDKFIKQKTDITDKISKLMEKQTELEGNLPYARGEAAKANLQKKIDLLGSEIEGLQQTKLIVDDNINKLNKTPAAPGRAPQTQPQQQPQAGPKMTPQPKAQKVEPQFSDAFKELQDQLVSTYNMQDIKNILNTTPEGLDLGEKLELKKLAKARIDEIKMVQRRK